MAWGQPREPASDSEARADADTAPVLHIAPARAMESLRPPWHMEADQARFLGTVAEPLCDPPPGVEPTRAALSSVATCTVDGEGVRLELRPDLRRPDQPEEVGWDQILDALAPVFAADGIRLREPGGEVLVAPAGEARMTYEVERDLLQASGAWLRAWRPSDAHGAAPGTMGVPDGPAVHPAYLQRLLSEAPVAWSEDDETGCALVGTGPFRVVRLHSADPGKIPSCGTSADEEELPAWASDRLRLQTWQTGPPRVLEFLTPRNREALEQAIEAGDVDLALSSDAPPRTLPEGWQRQERSRFTLYAAVSPARYPQPDQARALSDRLRRRLTPTLLRQHSLRPTTVLLPRALGVFEAPFAPLAAGPESSPLVPGVRAHAGEGRRQEAIAVAEAVGGIALTTPTSTDRSFREDGAFDLHVLALTWTDNGLASFVEGLATSWFDLPTTATVPCGDPGPALAERTVLSCATRLAERELALRATTDGALDADFEGDLALLLEVLHAWLVPIGDKQTTDLWDPTRVAGFDATTGTLIPSAIGRRTNPAASKFPAYLVAALLGTWLLALTLGSLQERRRRKLQQRFDQFHHELSSPLSSIAARSKRLARHPEVQAQARELLDLAQHALDIIDGNQHLLGSKEKDQPPPRAHLCADGIRPALAEVKHRLADGASLDLRLDLLESDPTVALRKDELRRLFANLAENAVHHGRTTRPRLEVRVSRAGRKVTVDFVDHGAGIAADVDPERLFQPYQRGPGTDGLPGMGLGLYICRQLAQRAGGSLVVVKKQDPTIFRLTLEVTDE